MFKKALFTTLTATLMATAITGTALAATNPFSDVPSDSWAYDAVSTLAKDGVIEGFPDNTYQGQKTMTRYEMAQIVARAMTKENLSKADKETVDKLAKEFASELDNLGVRVADLEKKSDNVVWGSKVRYRYYSTDHDSTSKTDTTYHHIIFRLEPKAFIGNSGWIAKSRINYDSNLNTDSNSDVPTIDRAWVEGPLLGGKVQAGKVPLFTAQGMIIDDPFSGVTFTFGNDTLKTMVMAGRYNYDHTNTDSSGNVLGADEVTAEYYGVQLDYTDKERLSLNAGYTTLKNIEKHSFKYADGLQDGDNLNLWYVGGKYAFDKNIGIFGEYSHSNASDNNTAYDIEMTYKNADKTDPGSWSAYAGYRNFERNAVIKPTQNVPEADQKGYVFGINYVPAENILATVEYFDGKDIIADKDASKFFGQIEFYFL